MMVLIALLVIVLLGWVFPRLAAVFYHCLCKIFKIGLMNKMKFVIVGCGRIAHLHVAGYKQHADGMLWGVYDKNLKTAKAFAAKHGIKKVYDSFEAVLKDADVVGVELIIPHHLHCAYTVRAAQAKKHVSVQKPMAMNLAECDQMIQAAKANGVKLKVYENFVFYPPYQKAKELLDAGEIGTPAGIRLKMNNGTLLSRNVPDIGKKKLSDNRAEGLPETGWKIDTKSWLWRFNETLSGGGPTVFDDGYHKFSLAIYFLGPVEKVVAWIDQTAVVPGIYNDVPAVVMWKYKDKPLYGTWDIVSSDEMYITSKYYTCDERVEMTGSRGVIWVTRCTGTLMPEVAPVLMYRDGKTAEFWEMPHDWQDSFIRCTADFIEAIRDDQDPILTGEQGRAVLKFALATVDSSRKNQAIYLDDYEDQPVPKRRGLLGGVLFKKR